MSSKCLDHAAYKVGWVCPLEIDCVAALNMLDEVHERLPQRAADSNIYTLGSINNHNIAVTGLPLAGNLAAAAVATQMRMTFPNIKYVLLVGTGGGVPRRTENGMIRLGHVVVSKPTGTHSGAVQYDHGKARDGQFERTGCLAPAPAVLLGAAQALAVHRERSDHDPVWHDVKRTQKHARAARKFAFPGVANDHLFPQQYAHRRPEQLCSAAGCDLEQQIPRTADEMDDSFVVVHRGTIGSGELLLRDAALRDRLADQDDIICFEMEAAGVLNAISSLVIRGISNYCDSHKNDQWRGYAAAVAAAYARQIFFHLPRESWTTINMRQHTFLNSPLSTFSDSFDQIWHGSDGESIKKLEGRTDVVESAIVSHDSAVIASPSGEKTVRVWPTSTGECIKTLDGYQGQPCPAHMIRPSSCPPHYSSKRIAHLSGSSEDVPAIV